MIGQKPSLVSFTWVSFGPKIISESNMFVKKKKKKKKRSVQQAPKFGADLFYNN